MAVLLPIVASSSNLYNIKRFVAEGLITLDLQGNAYRLERMIWIPPDEGEGLSGGLHHIVGTYQAIVRGIRADPRYGHRHKVIFTEAGLARMYKHAEFPPGDVGWWETFRHLGVDSESRPIEIMPRIKALRQEPVEELAPRRLARFVTLQGQ